MELILLVVHVVACFSILALVLLQQGKGSDMGAAFGSGASNTVFGSPGSASFLLKLTGFVAFVFFATSIILGHEGAAQSQKQQNADILPLPISNTSALPMDSSSKGKTDQTGFALPQAPNDNNGSQ